MSEGEDTPQTRPRPLRMLIASSIRHQSKRSLVQVLLVATVVVTGGACVIAGRGGGQAIVNTVESSGASLYRLSANNRETKSNEAVDVDLIEQLASLPGVNYVSAHSQFNPSIHSDAKPNPTQRPVLAVTPSYLRRANASVAVGLPILADNSAGFGVALGQRAASDLGITRACVAAQTCEVSLDGRPYVVSAVLAGAEMTDGIFVDLSAATAAGVVDGPAELVVSANGLPAVDTRRSLDLIASAATDQLIFVREPAAAAALREGVSTTWQSTIAAMAVLVLAMGIAGQIAIQRAIVRSRHTEIATLRSIGYPPRFIVVQFLAEPVLLATAGALLGFGLLAVGSGVSSRLFSYDLDLPLPSGVVLAANALVVSAGASMLAANSASKVSPAEILHR